MDHHLIKAIRQFPQVWLEPILQTPSPPVDTMILSHAISSGFCCRKKTQKLRCPPFLSPMVLRRQRSYELNVLVNPAGAGDLRSLQMGLFFGGYPG